MSQAAPSDLPRSGPARAGRSRAACGSPLHRLATVRWCSRQQLVCRWLFPVPEVEGFNRIHHTQLNVFREDIVQARQRGLSNVKIRWESEPDGFAFDHTLNLYGFRGPGLRRGAVARPAACPVHRRQLRRGLRGQ